MNWDDLNGVWRGQTDKQSEAPDLRALETAFAARQRKLAAQLFWRDVREAAAALVVAAVFGYIGWQMGPIGWPMVVAVALLLALAGFFVRERWRVRQGRVGADAPLLAKLNADVAELQRQLQLLRTVAWWYVGPSIGAAGLLAAVVLVHAPLPLVARLLVGAAMAGIMALVAWAAIAWSRSAAKATLEPHLRDLETLRAELRGSE